MRTRGISLPEARLLLMYAFAADVIENIRIPSLANRMKMLVEKRMRGELGMHEVCTLCMH
jgi:Fe-S cluster assembly protein SufD